jgi:hypothetical protein
MHSGTGCTYWNGNDMMVLKRRSSPITELNHHGPRISRLEKLKEKLMAGYASGHVHIAGELSARTAVFSTDTYPLLCVISGHLLLANYGFQGI